MVERDDEQVAEGKHPSEVYIIKVYSFIIGSLNLLVYLVLVFFFAKYSFANPDQEDNLQCWAIASNRIPISEEQNGYTNVSGQFRTWFLWGFILLQV